MGGAAYEHRVARSAKRTEYNGRMYASRAEAKYANTLDLLVSLGAVTAWTPQVRIHCHVNGNKICDYVADFHVQMADGTEEYIDVKGRSKPTAMFNIKQKLVRACTGIEVIVK